DPPPWHACLYGPPRRPAFMALRPKPPSDGHAGRAPGGQRSRSAAGALRGRIGQQRVSRARRSVRSRASMASRSTRTARAVRGFHVEPGRSRRAGRPQGPVPWVARGARLTELVLLARRTPCAYVPRGTTRHGLTAVLFIPAP